MACVSKRRGRWVADFRYPDGRRGWRSFRSQDEAIKFLARQPGRGTIQGGAPRIDPRTQLDAYAEHVFSIREHSVSVNTIETYRLTYRAHVSPTLGRTPIGRLDRPAMRALLQRALAAGFKPRTVSVIATVLTQLGAAALEDGILAANPASGLHRATIPKARRTEPEEVRALDRKQRDHLLEVLAAREPATWPICYAMSRTGLRIGEAIALRWEDVDIPGQQLRITASRSRRRMGPTKSGRSREVDCSAALAAQLAAWRASERRAALGMPEWVFPSPTGLQSDAAQIEKAFKRGARAAELPTGFTPHCLRHTYARLMLEAGADVLYLSRQLGHRSLSMTVDLYGRWARLTSPGTVDRLDSATQVVAVVVAEQVEIGAATALPVQSRHVRWARRARLSHAAAAENLEKQGGGDGQK